MIISPVKIHADRWRVIVLLVLAFWLSSSLVFDLILMPGLYVSGMMSQPDFVPAGHLLFNLFNRVELLCAALIATGFLVQCQVRQAGQVQGRRLMLGLPLLLLGVALAYTYVLTPQMSALGLSLNLFAPTVVPTQMGLWHQSYWLLEVLKLSAGGVLLYLCYRYSPSDRSVAS